MRNVDPEDRSPLPKYVCVLDAQERNKECQGLFSPAQQQLAQKVKDKATQAWIRSSVYLNYRKGFAAIKVSKPTQADKISDEVHALNEFCIKNNIDIDYERGSLIYRIGRKD